MRRAAVEAILGGASINRQVQYAYDALRRLTSENIVNGAPSGAIVYDSSTGYQGYDAVGNRRSRSVAAALQGPALTDFNNGAFNANDQISTSTYDFNGNTTVNNNTTFDPLPAPAISPTAGHPDQDDFDNRLVQRYDGATTIQIVYDGDGNRVMKAVNGAATYYLVDDRNPSGYAQVLEELIPSGSNLKIMRAYNYGHSLISEALWNGTSWELHYYGYDGHGSVRFLMGADGTMQNAYTYDAFGILISQTGSTPNNYLYSGEQFDFDLGEYYLRARSYNPNTGRFWTRDTAEGSRSDPSSLHKYLYVAGNPVNRVDRSGHDDLVELMASTQIRVLISVAAVSVTAVVYEKYGRENGGRGDQPQLPNLGSPYLTANHHAIRIRNSRRTLSEMYERLRSLHVPEGIASPSGDLPVSGSGQRIGWSLPFLEEVGEADFYVKTVKFSNDASATGPGDHFFAVVTLQGHPLRGWRFWRTYQVGDDIVVETGAVDEPNGLLGRIKANQMGGNAAIVQLWQGLLEDALTYSRGQRVTPDADFDFPQGHWVPGRKQEFLNLVQ